LTSWQIWLELSGGLALFLYGMKVTGAALKHAAATKLREWVQRLVAYPALALASGVLLSATLQSSSAASVMVIGLTSAGLINMKQALALALGAGIGTTVTPHLVTIKITDYALIFVVGGVLANLFASKRSGGFDKAALGFGLIFYGLKLMLLAMEPLRYSPATADFLARASEHNWQLVGAGALITALIQSSSAVVSLTVTMGQQGLLSASAGLAVVVGANIGTTATGILSSLTGSGEARRVATTYMLFQVAGAILVIAFFPIAERLVLLWPGGSGSRIATANTLFNIFIALVFLPVLPIISRLVLRYWPTERPEEAPVQLAPELVQVPGFALYRINLVVDEMAVRAEKDVVEPLVKLLLLEGDSLSQAPPLATQIVGSAESVRETYRRVVRSLGDAGQAGMTRDQSAEELRLLLTAADLRGAVDQALEIVGSLARAEEQKVRFSSQGKGELGAAAQTAQLSFSAGVAARHEPGRAAETALAYHELVSRQVSDSRQQHFGRVRKGVVESVLTSELHEEILAAIGVISQLGVRLGDSGLSAAAIATPDVDIETCPESAS